MEQKLPDHKLAVMTITAKEGDPFKKNLCYGCAQEFMAKGIKFDMKPIISLKKELCSCAKK